MSIFTKKELVKEVTTNLKAAEISVNQKTTEEMLDIVTETIATILEKGDGVRLPGFVTFEVQDVPEKEARNPQTGEKLVVPAHKKLKTKVSSTLKNRIR